MLRPLESVFPAQRITTDLEWDDLVLNPATRQEIDDILTWVQNKDVLMDKWQLKQRIKPGFRCLFYGPPGTGKTMTVCLLGKKSGLPVYRIDLFWSSNSGHEFAYSFRRSICTLVPVYDSVSHARCRATFAIVAGYFREQAIRCLRGGGFRKVGE